MYCVTFQVGPLTPVGKALDNDDDDDYDGQCQINAWALGV